MKDDGVDLHPAGHRGRDRDGIRAGKEGRAAGVLADGRMLYRHGACLPELVPLEGCANTEKKIPDSWITEDGANVTQDFIDYALPLIQGQVEFATENGLPRYARLDKYQAGRK